MATIREIQTIEIPILLTKDLDKDGGDAFLLTCRPLSIYIQAKTEKQAEMDFKHALDHLFKHLIQSKKLLRFLKQRNLIHSEQIRIAKSVEDLEKLRQLEEKIRDYHLKTFNKIELGNYSKAEIELAAA